MGKRRYQRIKTVLPVRLFGVDGVGKPFAEVAHTLDVSHSGVRLGGVNVAPEVGAIITLQCQHRKCNFSVAWVGRPGSSRNKQLGLLNLEPDRDIFGVRLKAETFVDDFVQSADSMEANAPGGARRAPRFLANGTASIHRVNSLEERLADIQDIGRTGCYLKTPTPYKVATQVGLTLRVDGATIQVFGKVTTCHPMMGMGVEFERYYTEEDESSMRLRLARLEEANPLPLPVVSTKPDTSAIAERLQKVTQELEDVDQLMQSGTVDPRVLGEFRDAVSQVRNTAWALQQWMEAQQRSTPFPVLSYLNAERIAVATRLCESLFNELQRTDVSRQKLKLEGLLSAVERLFTKLAGIDFLLLDPTASNGDPAGAEAGFASAEAVTNESGAEVLVGGEALSREESSAEAASPEPDEAAAPVKTRSRSRSRGR